MDTPSTLRCIAIIPARMASSRLPGKVLSDIGGKAMLHHVVDAARAAQLFDQITVATDSEEVIKYCDKHQIACELTLATHTSGTERVAELALRSEAEAIVNLQADEPFISIEALQQIYTCIQQPHVQIASLCCPVATTEALLDYNVVKVTKTVAGEALYFSRQAIPAHRDRPYREWLERTPYYQHLGVYAYKRQTLEQIVTLPTSPLAVAESLEQLTWLEHGYRVHLAEVAASSLGVDTPEDLAAARKHYKYVLSKK